ncbi:MAG TPA: ABC transporter ATP-binding protein [Dongiaceae bacterium]|nr:ABC transporter ATP-binding protein [Dongiaceae bacterium]
MTMTQPSNQASLLDVANLRVTLRTVDGPFDAVRGVSFCLGRERLGIVGESGSGKSMTARAILGLLPRAGRLTADRLQLGGTDLRGVGDRAWTRVRGRRISMVLQDPRHALNPVKTIGRQIDEVLRRHLGLSRREARARTLTLLEAVHIRDPERVYRAFPHAVSGGMGQRAMIALMVAAEPEVLIADEPTSALDLAVQNQVLNVLDEQVVDRGMGLIFISHDLDLVSRFCDRVLVMYGGEVVEELPADRLSAATHPYTRGLIDCAPRLGQGRQRFKTLDRAAISRALQDGPPISPMAGPGRDISAGAQP